MDYVIITAILTFFVLFFVRNKEGYTDAYVNTAIDNLKKTMDNISTIVNNIKNLSGTTVGSNEVKMDVLDSIEQITESLKVNTTMPPTASTELDLQKTNLTSIQDNIIRINKKLKEVLESANVPIIRLNEKKPVMVPLLTAINFISEDIKSVNYKLQAIPDVEKDK
jgi:hypothetical protein